MQTVLADMSLPHGKPGEFRIARSGRRMLRKHLTPLHHQSQDPDAPPAASQPAGPMPNPAAAPPGRVAVLGDCPVRGVCILYIPLTASRK